MDASLQGRAHAFTVLTPIRRGVGRPWLRLVLGIARRTGFGTKTLLGLEMLYVARFSFVHDLPGERLPYRWFLFESNFNGSWDRYIDTFAYVLGPGMRRLWGACRGFPGAKPVTRFKQYIKGNELECAHYYVAYKDASARTVLAALRLEKRFEDFRATAHKDPDGFREDWTEFLTANQRDV